MYFVASAADLGKAAPAGGAGRPGQQNSIALLFFVYLALLWRSTSKTMLFMRQNITKDNILKLTAKAQLALITYLSNKAFLALRFLLVALTFVLNKLFKGRPAVLAAEFFTNQTVAWQDQMQGRLEVWLDGQLDFLGEKTKETIKDPYMPMFVQKICDDLVDTLLPDSKRLILTKTDELIRSKSIVTRHLHMPQVDARALGPAQSRLKPTAATASSAVPSLLDPVSVVFHSAWNVAASPYRIYQTPSVYKPMLTYTYWMGATSEPTAAAAAPMPGDAGDAILDDVEDDFEDEDDDIEDEDDLLLARRRRTIFQHGKTRLLQLPSQIRAKILYTCSPCDKSSWQCFQDVRWWVLTGFGLLPYGLGTIWWLFLFTLHDKRDEYQVSNFIVGFMVSKFLGGVGLLILGAFKYYLCATVNNTGCMVDGPRIQEHIDAVLFFVQISLVWLCFFLLPMTEPCRVVLDSRDLHLVIDMDRVHKKVTTRTRGGRLGQMFWWESTCVLFVFSLAVVAIYLHLDSSAESSRLLTELFWLKVVFGLLSMPFLVFKIPILSTLLMQVRSTGYDSMGRVVLHTKARQEPSPTTNGLEFMKPAENNAAEVAAATKATTVQAEKDEERDITMARLSDNEESDGE